VIDDDSGESMEPMEEVPFESELEKRFERYLTITTRRSNIVVDYERKAIDRGLP